MYSKPIKNKKIKKYFFELLKGSDDCEVSRASTEIMLDRFCKGKKIEFPFSS